MMIYLRTNEFDFPILYLTFDFIKSTGNPPHIETIIGVITMATTSNPIGWAVDSWIAKTRTPKHIKIYIAKKNPGFSKPFIESIRCTYNDKHHLKFPKLAPWLLHLCQKVEKDYWMENKLNFKPKAKMLDLLFTSQGATMIETNETRRRWCKYYDSNKSIIL